VPEERSARPTSPGQTRRQYASPRFGVDIRRSIASFQENSVRSGERLRSDKPCRDVQFRTGSSLDLRVSNLKEFVALAKREPEKFLYGYGNVIGHILAEQLGFTAGLKAKGVFYKGEGEVVTGILSDAISMGIRLADGRTRARSNRKD